MILGDDSDCIDVQFDEWQSEFIPQLKEWLKQNSNSGDNDSGTKTSSDTAQTQADQADTVQSSSSISSSESSVAALQTGASLRLLPTTDENAQQRPVLDHAAFIQQLDATAFFDPKPELKDVKLNSNVTPDSSRSMYHILFDNTTEPYHTGDHLGVYPSNSQQDVDAAMQLIDIGNAEWDIPIVVEKLNPSTRLLVPVDQVKGLTPQDWLKHALSLNSVPTPGALRRLATYCADSSEREALTHLSDSQRYKTEVAFKSLSFLEILQLYPSVRLPFADALTLIPPIRPRFYSICTSPRAHPDDVGLTYRLLEYTSPSTGKLRQGLCSSYLARHKVGTTVPIFPRESDFRLPFNPEHPAICVAAGTGIAPFLGFIEEHRVSRFHFVCADVFAVHVNVTVMLFVDVFVVAVSLVSPLVFNSMSCTLHSPKYSYS
eukprot:m.177580 g.177580  ORF g.177580 m.177580 type:complete len:431 (-) comp14632_c0_seq60:1659-2951(-)